MVVSLINCKTTCISIFRRFTNANRHSARWPRTQGPALQVAAPAGHACVFNARSVCGSSATASAQSGASLHLHVDSDGIVLPSLHVEDAFSAVLSSSVEDLEWQGRHPSASTDSSPASTSAPKHSPTSTSAPSHSVRAKQGRQGKEPRINGDTHKSAHTTPHEQESANGKSSAWMPHASVLSRYARKQQLLLSMEHGLGEEFEASMDEEGDVPSVQPSGLPEAEEQVRSQDRSQPVAKLKGKRKKTKGKQGAQPVKLIASKPPEVDPVAAALQLKHDRDLTTSITLATSWRRLACLFTEHRSSLNHIHLSALLQRLVHLEGLSKPSVLATMQHKPPAMQRRTDASAEREQLDWMVRGEAQLDNGFREGSLRVGVEVPHAAQAAAVSEYAALANALPDMDMGSRLPAAVRGGSQVLHAGQLSSSALWPVPIGTTLADAAARKYPTAQHLARAVSKEAQSQMRVEAMSMQEISSVLRDVLKLKCPTDKPTAIRFMTRAFHLMAPVKDGVDPDPHAMTTQGLSELIRAVAGFGMKGLRRDWADRFLAAVDARCGDFSAQGVALVLHSLAELGHMPPPALRQRLLERLVQLAEHSGGASADGGEAATLHCTPPDVSLTIRALAVLRTQPPKELGDRLLVATQWLLPLFTAQELANTVWGLAKLRSRPPSEAWCEDFCSAASRVMLLRPLWQAEARGSAQALSMTLYSLALLGMRPDEGWLAACLLYTIQHFGSFTLQGLSCVVCGVALMGYHPGHEWLQRFHRGVDSGFQEMHPASMAMLRKAYALLQFSPGAGSEAMTAAWEHAGLQEQQQLQQREHQLVVTRAMPAFAEPSRKSVEMEAMEALLEMDGWASSSEEESDDYVQKSRPVVSRPAATSNKVSRPSRFAAR